MVVWYGILQKMLTIKVKYHEFLYLSDHQKEPITYRQNILKYKWFLYDACSIVWTSNIQNLLTCKFWQFLAFFAKHQWFLYNACSYLKASIIQKQLTFGENSVDSVWCLFAYLFPSTYRIYLYSTEKCPKLSRFCMMLAHTLIRVIDTTNFN